MYGYNLHSNRQHRKNNVKNIVFVRSTKNIKKLPIIVVLQEITIQVYLNNSNCIIVHTTRITTYQIQQFRNNEGLEFTFAVLLHNADHFCK